MSPGWVDFGAVKESVGIRELLAWYGLAIPESRLEWRGRCPVHGGQGEQSFHVHFGKNVFHCFACGAGGNVLDLVAALECVTVREAALRLRDRFSLANQQPRQCFPAQCRTAAKLVTKKIRGGMDSSDNPPLGFQLTGLSRGHPYIASRQIRPETVEEFGIGVYSGPGLMSERLVIPIHNVQGELVAYAGRALDRMHTPRYLFPRGFRKSSLLYNFHRAAAEPDQAGIVVEGFLDCMRVWQTGHRSVVALMGVAMSPNQQALLVRRFRRIVLMLDGDRAGREASRELAARFSCEVAVSITHLPEGSQPDKASDCEINRFLSEASEGWRLFTQTA